MLVELPPNIRSQIYLAANYFEIPSFKDVYAHAATALHDSFVASKSIRVYLRLTTRPLCILIGLMSHYLCILLKVLADCTVQHLIIGFREGWKQAHFAFNWFVQFQRGLSRAAVLIEIGVICVMIVLCAVQRYIKKKKYVERIFRWYNQKRRALQMKYEIFVDGVAQTSMVLALLLPHILYSLAVFSVKYVAPSFVRYLATKTILVSVISVYYPILKTINVVHRWVGIELLQKKENDGISDATSLQKCGTEGEWGGLKKNNIADKYLEAASQSAAQDTKRSSMLVMRKNSDKKLTNDNSDSDEDLTEEVTELLKYWSVYAFLTATYCTLSLLPVIGRILSNNGPVVSRYRISLLDKIYLSKEFTEEVKLVFFVWLNLFSRRKRGENDRKIAINSVNRNVIALENKSSRKHVIPFTNRPLDLIYERLSPVATSLVQSSTTSLVQSPNIVYQKDTSAIEKSNEDNARYTIQSIIMKVISGFRSLLDVLVWSKIISDKKKSHVIAIMIECVDLIPALATLFMPSYFTSYGVIYVRLVVPGAKSAHALNALQRCSDSDAKNLKHDSIAAVVRFLRYWVIHCILLIVLTSFSPILNWIPLATHMKWILWAYVHLESSTLHLYGIFSRDLEAFGLLNQHTSNGIDNDELDINDTVVARVFQSICNRLPSGSTKIDNAPIIVNTILDDDKHNESSNLLEQLDAHQIPIST